MVGWFPSQRINNAGHVVIACRLHVHPKNKGQLKTSFNILDLSKSCSSAFSFPSVTENVSNWHRLHWCRKIKEQINMFYNKGMGDYLRNVIIMNSHERHGDSKYGSSPVFQQLPCCAYLILCKGNSMVTGGFPSQMAGDAKKVVTSYVFMLWELIHGNLTCAPKHDDPIKWKHFPRYWPFVRGTGRSSVNSPQKAQWRRALMFYLVIKFSDFNKYITCQLIHKLHVHCGIVPNVCNDYCLTLVRLLSLPITRFVNWCGSTKIFWSHLKMCSSSKDSFSILTKSCVR